MAFGSIGRQWAPRFRHAGTYDQHWLDHEAPFWPSDFRHDYFQSAPQDQQLPYPVGGEPLVLRNLTPEGYFEARLPKVEMPILFLPHTAPAQELQGVLDTILIEPDLGRICMTWRARFHPHRDCFDLRQVIAGESMRRWRQTRGVGGKKRHVSLAELVRERAKTQ
jgi:hypothetical protein